MIDNPYPPEVLGEGDDDGTMPNNVADLSELIIGHRIVSATQCGYELVLTLDGGKRVKVIDGYDCCAYTELEKFFLHPESINHVITGVGTTDGFTTWHVFADMGDVLTLDVNWGRGNGCYGYGFSFAVEDVEPLA